MPCARHDWLYFRSQRQPSAALGGIDMLLSTNPIAVGAALAEPPLILRHATTVARL